MKPGDMWYLISILIVLHHKMLLSLQQCETCPYATEQHGESCYYFNPTSKTFSQAVSKCSVYGFHLVYIETAEEQDFIEGRMRENNAGDYWIGLTVDSDGQGVWLDGSSLTYDNTESDSYNEGGECVRMVASYGYTWHDRDCSYYFRYVCEKENECSTKTTLATTELVTTTATTTTLQPSTKTVTTTTQPTTINPTTQPYTTTATTTTQLTTTKPKRTTQTLATTSGTTTITTASPKARQRSNRYKIIARDTAIMDSAVVKQDSTSTLIRCAALCLTTESCSRFTFSADNGDCLLGGVSPNDKHDFKKRPGALTFEVI